MKTTEKRVLHRLDKGDKETRIKRYKTPKGAMSQNRAYKFKKLTPMLPSKVNVNLEYR